MIVIKLVKEFPAFYGTRNFITVSTRARHWSLFRARCIQFTPSHTISLTSITLYVITQKISKLICKYELIISTDIKSHGIQRRKPDKIKIVINNKIIEHFSVFRYCYD